MLTKMQLATQIIDTTALLCAPAPSPAHLERQARKLRRLMAMPKAELVALHADYHHISADTEALIELIAEALDGHPAILSVSLGVVRVEQTIAEFGAARIAGFDAMSRLLTEAGFHFNTGGCTCFVLGL